MFLVSKVGYKEDVAGELEALSQITGISHADLVATAESLHDVPGFVAKAGRYYYITPAIIAQIAFDLAWRRWAEVDPTIFMNNIPGNLLGAFLNRTARSAEMGVRSLIGEFFRQWASTLDARDLVDIGKVDELNTLVELETEIYLPILSRIISHASKEQLLSIAGNSVNGKWGPRRQIVWLAERMVAFPEFFNDAEIILKKLALAENEEGIGNNATEIWYQLYRIHLSGTAIPFDQRLIKLQQYIYHGSTEETALALNALSRLLGRHISRMAGPPVVAGRIPPKEWRPETREALTNSIDAIVNLLINLLSHEDSAIRSSSQRVILDNLDYLIESGYIEQLRQIFKPGSLDDQTLVQVTSAIREYIKLSNYRNDLNTILVRQITDWLSELTPQDIHGRIITSVGIEPWEFHGNEEPWKTELRAIASYLLNHVDLFEREIGWLLSEEALSAAQFGRELAAVDSDGSLLGIIIGKSTGGRNTGLARGYVLGLVTDHPNIIAQVNSHIEALMSTYPQLAYELSISGGDGTKALSRAIQLVDQKLVSPVHLQVFSHGIGNRHLTEEEVHELLSRLLTVDSAQAEACGRVALHLLSFSRNDEIELLQNDKIRGAAWQLLELAPVNMTRENYYWGRLLIRLAGYNPEKAARVAANVLVSKNYNFEKEALDGLCKFAEKNPEIVMNAVGQVALPDDTGWKFHINKYDKLINALPVGVVLKWIRDNGEKAAKRLARHLPPPYINDHKRPIVPELTAFVLTEFEESEAVFNEFMAGTHSFQMYSGDIASQHLSEAEVAKKFLNDPIRRIREWAEFERASALKQAEYWRKQNEELFLE